MLTESDKEAPAQPRVMQKLLAVMMLCLLAGCANFQKPINQSALHYSADLAYAWIKFDPIDPRWSKFPVGALVIHVDGTERGVMRLGQLGVLGLRKGERKIDFFWNDSYPFWPNLTISPDATERINVRGSTHHSITVIVSYGPTEINSVFNARGKMTLEPTSGVPILHVSRKSGRLFSESLPLTMHYVE